MKKKKKTEQNASLTPKKPSFSIWADQLPKKFTKEYVKNFLVSNIPFLIVITFLGFLLYINNAGGNFLIADDIPGLVDNPVIRDLNKAWETGKANIILDALTFNVSHGTPTLFHIRSIFLHIANTFLVYVFLSMIFNKKLSTIATLIFLAHPINTEAVSWISSWIYLALSFFSLLVFITFVAYRKTEQQVFLWLSVLLCAVYTLFFTDNWVFTIPILVVIIDQLLVEKKINLSLSVIRNYIPLLAIGAFHGIYLVTHSLDERISVLKNLYYNDISQATPFIQRVPYTLFMTFKQYAFPKDLTIYHEGYLITPEYFAVMVIFSLFVAFMVGYLLVKNRPLAGLIILLIASILPSYSPVPVAWLMADRYLYRGTIFFAVLVAWLILFLEQKYKASNFAVFATVILLVALSARTFARNFDWNNDKNLWLATKDTCPYSPRVYNNLGDVYFKEKDYQKAIQHFQVALQLKPDFADVVHNLGYTYLEMDNVELAKQYFQKSYEMNPYLYQSLYKLGFIAYREGNLELAEQYFTKSIEVYPDFISAKKALDIIKQLKLQQAGNKETIK